MYVNAIYIYMYTSEKNPRQFSTGGSSTNKTSGGARMGIGRFVKGFSKAFGAFQTSYDAWLVTVLCLDGHR